MNNDLISRSELKKALCEEYEAREHYIGEIMLKAIDNAPTVDIKDIYQEGYYDGHLEGYTKAINEERPQAQGKWICPNCDLYEQAENNYCQYAGRCTIVCRKCKYFKRKDGAEK